MSSGRTPHATLLHISQAFLCYATEFSINIILYSWKEFDGFCSSFLNIICYLLYVFERHLKRKFINLCLCVYAHYFFLILKCGQRDLSLKHQYLLLGSLPWHIWRWHSNLVIDIETRGFGKHISMRNRKICRKTLHKTSRNYCFLRI